MRVLARLMLVAALLLPASVALSQAAGGVGSAGGTAAIACDFFRDDMRIHGETHVARNEAEPLRLRVDRASCRPRHAVGLYDRRDGRL